jgi:hypothetical protein
MGIRRLDENSLSRADHRSRSGVALQVAQSVDDRWQDARETVLMTMKTMKSAVAEWFTIS